MGCHNRMMYVIESNAKHENNGYLEDKTNSQAYCVTTTRYPASVSSARDSVA